MLAALSLREEGVERILSSSNAGVRGHLAVWLDAVLQAEKLPNVVTELATSLSEVDSDDFAKTHDSG
jgi:hypothetical protein